MKWLRRFRQWNQTLVTGKSIAVNMFILLFSYLIVIQVHEFCFRQGWFKSPSHFDLEEMIPMGITACILGLIEVSDRRRAKETEELKAAGKDRTMI